MILVPEKSREGTSTAPRPGGIAANTASISSAVTSGMSDSTVQTVVAPCGDQLRGGERDGDVQSARIFLVDCDRSRRSRHREQRRVRRHDRDSFRALRAERGGQHVAEHRLGQRAALARRQRRRQPSLGEVELLGGYQDETHGVSL